MVVRSVMLVVALLLFASPALAQDTTKIGGVNDNPYTLEEIVVYGNPDGSEATRATEFRAEALEERATTSVADFLRSDPALNVTTGAKAETETKIRGFPAFDVLVLVDGRPLNPGYYGKVDLSMLPVGNIAKLQIIKGPASAAYAMNGMGGVINIITKNGLETPATTLDASFGDYRFRNLSLNHSYRIGIFNYWISAYEQYSDGFRLGNNFTPTSLEDGGLRGNSAFHKMGGNIKLGIEPGRDVLCALSLGYNRGSKDIPTTIYSWDSPTYRSFPSYERFNAALTGQWLPGTSAVLKALVLYDAYDDRLKDYSTPAMLDDKLNYDSYLSCKTIGATADARYSFTERNSAQAGVQIKYDRMDKQPDIDATWERHSMNSGCVFLQDTQQFFETTSMTAGVNASFSRAESSGASGSAVSPVLGIAQELPFRIHAYANYAHAVRYPSLNHLFSETSGNPALRPEYSRKYEIGLKRTDLVIASYLEAGLDCAFFYNSLNDLIYRASNSYRYKNIAEATLKGIELRSTLDFFRLFHADVDWAILAGNGSASEIMQEVSPQTFRVLLSVQTSFGLAAS